MTKVSFYKFVINILKVLFLLFISNSYSQIKPDSTEDYLMNSDYNDLLKEIYDHYNTDSSFAKKLTKVYLKKSKRDSQITKKARGYHLLSRFYSNNSKKYLAYLDSSIFVSKDVVHMRYPSIAYLNKGVHLEKKGKLILAIENYSLCAKYAEQGSNTTLLYYAIHNIGVLKKRVKKYQDAKRFFLQVLDYELAKESMTYIDSLSYLATVNELIDTYILSSQLDSAKILNKKSYNDFKTMDQSFLFKLNEAVILCHEDNNEEALKILQPILPILTFKKKKYGYDFDYYAINAFYYNGLALKKLGYFQDAIKSWLKVDSIVEKNNYVSYLSKKTYAELLSMYTDNGNKELRLSYISKYLKTDSLISKDLHALDEKIIEDYDRPHIINQKNELLKSLNTEIRNKNNLYFISIFIGVLLIFTIIIYFFRQNRFKNRLNTLMLDIEAQKKSRETNNNNFKADKNDLKINDSVVQEILINLDEFENNKGFLDKNITIRVLAEILGTNTRYLSSTINRYKEKKFVDYINSLRIDYFIEQVNNNNNEYHKYTIKAIARECGFKSSEVFSKTFLRKTGIYPSYFMKNIKRSK